MRKPTDGQMAVGALIAFAIWVFVALPFLYYPRQDAPQGDPQTGQSKQQADNVGNVPPSFVPLKVFTSAGRDEIAAYCASRPTKEEQKWAHDYICDVKITDTYLAAFNFLLVVVTGGLIAIGYLTIRKMRTTEERQLRAYVFITDGGIISIDPITFQVLVKLRNSGLSPGYQFSTWIGGGVYLFEASPFPKEAKPLSHRGANSIIGPGETVEIDSKNPPVSMEESFAIRDEYLAIFAWGGCDYTDSFGKRWSFVFRIKVSGRPLIHEPGRICWALRGADAYVPAYADCN